MLDVVYNHATTTNESYVIVPQKLIRTSSIHGQIVLVRLRLRAYAKAYSLRAGATKNAATDAKRLATKPAN